MKKRMNRSEILFLLLSFYGAASAFAFQASLEVVSHNTAVDPHQLYFGMTAGASDNYDAGIDGFAPPTPQEPVRLDAYFPVSDPLVTRLVTDYRGVNASVTYTLKIRADIDRKWENLWNPLISCQTIQKTPKKHPNLVS